MSERKFYRKITGIYATSIDYDKTARSNLYIRFVSKIMSPVER